jgi:hypothetical protein
MPLIAIAGSNSFRPASCSEQMDGGTSRTQDIMREDITNMQPRCCIQGDSTSGQWW